MAAYINQLEIKINNDSKCYREYLRVHYEETPFIMPLTFFEKYGYDLKIKNDKIIIIGNILND